MPVVKTLTESEVRRIRAWMDKDMPSYYGPLKLARNRLLVTLMLDCGLRVGELVQLKWLFFRQYDKTDGVLEIPARLTKTKTSRTLPLPGSIIEDLKNYMEVCKIFRVSEPMMWLFPSGNPMVHLTTRNVQFIIRFIGMTTLSKEIHPHMLRHTYATRLMRVANTRIVQELLGHAKISSTQIYMHPTSKDLRGAVDKLKD